MKRIFDDVSKFGWHVVAIPAGDGEPEYAFTVGLYQTFEHPEFVVFGLPMKSAHGVLSTCVERIEAGDRFGEGQIRQDVLKGYSASILAVDPSFYSEYLGSAIGFYDSLEFPCLQLVWPDPHNRFPWDPKCDPAYVNSQVVLSVTAA